MRQSCGSLVRLHMRGPLGRMWKHELCNGLRVRPTLELAVWFCAAQNLASPVLVIPGFEDAVFLSWDLKDVVTLLHTTFVNTCHID